MSSPVEETGSRRLGQNPLQHARARRNEPRPGCEIIQSLWRRRPGFDISSISSNSSRILDAKDASPMPISSADRAASIRRQSRPPSSCKAPGNDGPYCIRISYKLIGSVPCHQRQGRRKKIYEKNQPRSLPLAESRSSISGLRSDLRSPSSSTLRPLPDGLILRGCAIHVLRGRIAPRPSLFFFPRRSVRLLRARMTDADNLPALPPQYGTAARSQRWLPV